MQDDPTLSNPRTAADGASRANDRRHRLITRAFDEARRFVVMFLYLWVLFGVFVLDERIVSQEIGLSVTWQGFALINALVLAKVMLVTEDLDLGRWLRGRPLIYRILHDSFLLTVLFICFHIAERVVVGLAHGATASSSLPAIGGGGAEGLISVAVILFVALIPFFAFRYVAKELGAARMKAILFETGDKVLRDR